MVTNTVVFRTSRRGKASGQQSETVADDQVFMPKKLPRNLGSLLNLNIVGTDRRGSHTACGLIVGVEYGVLRT